MSMMKKLFGGRVVQAGLGGAAAKPRRARASAVSWIPWVAAEVLAELARRGYAAVVDIEVRVVLDRAE
jgi:hypothetical protein